MATLTSSIVLIHPSNGEVGVALADTITVLFNTEVDTDSINVGSFLVEGPSRHVMTGPDTALHNTDLLGIVDTDSIWESSGYRSVLPGEFTFQQIDNSDSTLEVSGIKDTSGAGNLFRTKAIFTPTEYLLPDSLYSIFLAGDEDTTDTLFTGITKRTVFELVAGGSNTSTGIPVVVGPYTGDVSDVYRIEITASGVVGAARYKWYRDNAPSIIHGGLVVSKDRQILDNDVLLKWKDGTYYVGDTWSFVVVPPVYYTGTVTWEFQTGSGSITTVPSATATSVIGTSVSSTISGVPAYEFGITEVSPAHRAVQVAASTDRILVTFTNPLDAATIDDTTVTVTAEPANGDEDLLATRTLQKDLSVSGKTLTIRIR